MSGGWTIIDHACRVCLGRVLQHADNTRWFRCADCGIDGIDAPDSICACGAILQTGKSAGLRCVENPDRGPVAPWEVIATERP